MLQNARYAWPHEMAVSGSEATRRLRARSLRLPSLLSVMPFVPQPADGWVTHLGGRPRVPAHSREPGGEPLSAGIRPHRAQLSVRD